MSIFPYNFFFRNLVDEDVETILKGLKDNSETKYCQITHLNLSHCPKLTGNSVNSIVNYCQDLETLVLRKNSEILYNFTLMKKLKDCEKLTILNIAFTNILDGKLHSILKYLPNLKLLNLQGKIQT
jgi:hypothetical protein